MAGEGELAALAVTIELQGQKEAKEGLDEIQKETKEVEGGFKASHLAAVGMMVGIARASPIAQSILAESWLHRRHWYVPVGNFLYPRQSPPVVYHIYREAPLSVSV